MTTEQLGLDDVLATFVRRWRLILVVAVPVLLGVLGYTSTLPTTWKATSTVSFAPRPSVAVGADTVSLLVPGYLAFVRSPGTEAAVGTQYGVSAESLDRDVDVSVPPSTATLVIAVTGRSPDLVSNVANALAQAAVAHATQDSILTASLVSPAVPPSVASGPRRRPLQLAGLVGALLLGTLVAGAVERGFPRLRSASAVREGLDLPVLGRLPRATALRYLGGEGVDDAVVGNAVRTLRNQVIRVVRTQPVTVLAVCSAQRREGRSTVTALLAQALARLDLRVLIVDADTTRRALTDEYVLDAPPAEVQQRGLIAVLRGYCLLADAVYATGVSNVWILPSTGSAEVGDLVARSMPTVLNALRTPQRPAVPTEPSMAAPALLGRSGAEGAEFAQLATQVPAPPPYDVVLIDTPPLLERDEAAVLAGLVDQVLLVVDSGRTTASVRQAVTVLTTAGGRALGVVLNRTTRRSTTSGGAG